MSFSLADLHRLTFLGKLRIFGMIFIFSFVIFSFLDGILVHAQNQDTIAYTQMDPPNPTARYDLDKLNSHILDTQVEKEKVETLDKRLGVIEGQKLDTRILKIEEIQEQNSWWLKTIASGIVFLLLETVAKIFKIRFIRREQPE